MSQTTTNGKLKNVGGRPRKFPELSRPVTVTLPERTLAMLKSIDSDRALAIAKATDWATQSAGANRPPVEIVEVEKGNAIILVGPSRCLRELPWLRLVEIAPARFLLVIPTGTPVESLEVAVMDMIDSLKDGDSYERHLLSELQAVLTSHRRSEKVSKAELLLIDTASYQRGQFGDQAKVAERSRMV